MAYGEVYIDTRLRGIDDVVKDIKKLNTAMESLDLKMREAQMTGNTQSDAYRKMQARAEVYKEALEKLNAEYDYLSQNKPLDNQDETTKKATKNTINYKNACDKAAKSVKKLGNEHKKSNVSFGKGLKTLLKYTLGIRSLFVLFNKLRSALVDGFKNLAQFNNGINPVNTALSNLKSALTQLKNSFATAFEPILTLIEPALTRLINLLSRAMTVIGQFFASLAGARTFTRAVAVQEDYARSLGNTAKNAKKAQQYLSGLDEVKTFTSKNDESGSGGVSPNQMFETVEIENKIAEFADRVRSFFEPFADSFREWFSNIDFGPLLESLERLKTACEPLIGFIGEGLLWVFENVLQPLGSFVIEEALPHFFDLVSTAVEVFTRVLQQLRPVLEYIWNNVIAPFARFLGDIFIEVIDDLTDYIRKMGEMFSEKSEQINEILMFIARGLEAFRIVVETVFQFIVGMFEPLLQAIVNVVSHVIDVLSGLIDFIVGVFTGDWERAWNGIKDILKGIVNILADIIEGLVNMIIGGLNRISIDVPDWVPGIGGNHFGFNLQEIRLPRLATGTVVPRQSKEFAAILGDNNKETEVVSPLSTMKQAFLEAMSESGGFGGGSYNFTAQINRRVLFDEFIEEAKMRQTISGRNPLDLARV